MKNIIRITLLCIICMAGLNPDAVYAQNPLLEIYQVRVSTGHGTVVVVKDKTANERLKVEDLAIMKVKVTADSAAPFNRPYTVELEKETYDINGQLGVTYDGTNLEGAGSGLLGTKLIGKSSSLNGSNLLSPPGTFKTFEVAIVKDFDPAEDHSALLASIKAKLDTLSNPTNEQLYEQIINEVKNNPLFIAKKDSDADDIDSSIENLVFKVDDGSQNIPYEQATKLFPQHKVYKAIMIDTGVKAEDGTMMVNTVMYKAATKLNALFITHSDQDHWGGLGLGFSPSTQRYTSNATNGLEKYIVRDKIIGNGTEKVNFYYPSTPGEANDNYSNVTLTHGKSFYYYLKNLISALPGETDAQDDAAGTSTRNAFAYHHWFPNTEYDMYQQGVHTVKLSTLMANCVLTSKWNNRTSYTDFSSGEVGTGLNKRDLVGCNFDNKGVRSNNKSTVSVITWEKTGVIQTFKFLVQGDLESGSKSGNIAYTKQLFLEKIWTGANRTGNLITNWENPGSQAARQIARGGRAIPAELGIRVPRNTPFDDAFTIQGIERKGMKEGDNRYGTVSFASTGVRATGSTASAPVTQNLDQAVAYPDQGRFRLSAAIGDNVCLALIPHHGANTSNLWFKSKNVIYGTHKEGGGLKNGKCMWCHPKLTNVQAVNYNVGAKKYFFTWTDWSGGTIEGVRAVIGDTDGKSAFTLKNQDVGENTNQQYWVFRVQDTLDSFEVSNGSVSSKSDATAQIISNPGNRVFQCNE